VKLSLRNILLSVQVGVSVVLLVGAGLLVRGLTHVRSQNPGFAVADVSVVSFDLPADTYQGVRRQAFFTTLLQELERGGDGQSIGFTSLAPLSRSQNQAGCRLASEEDRLTLMLDISPGYFDVLRIPIINGRNFARPENLSNSIIVNETMAKRYWPNQSPIGKN